MSAAWAVALGVLTALVAVLAVAVMMLLTRVRELETRTQRLQTRLDTMRRRDRPAAPPPRPASSVVIMLEPERDTDRALVADLAADGGLSLGVPATVYVPDDGTGAALVDGTGLGAEPFYRERPLSAAFPSVVVLGEDGAVLRTGSPARTSELRGLVTGTVHTHAAA
jgi:hypothetical protein